MNFGDIGYIASNGKVEFADADSMATTGALVMALGTYVSNNYCDFLIMGVARDASWNWTPGGMIYVTVNGSTGSTLSQTPPSAAEDVVQIVGWALSANVMVFKPELTRIVLK